LPKDIRRFLLLRHHGIGNLHHEWNNTRRNAASRQREQSTEKDLVAHRVLGDEAERDDDGDSTEKSACREVAAGAWEPVDDEPNKRIDEVWDFQREENQALGCLFPSE